MIQSQEEYEIVQMQFGRALRALEDLRRDVEPKSKFNFAVMAEGYYEEISRLAAELTTFPPLDGPYGRKAELAATLAPPQGKCLDKLLDSMAVH